MMTNRAHNRRINAGHISATVTGARVRCSVGAALVPAPVGLANPVISALSV